MIGKQDIAGDQGRRDQNVTINRETVNDTTKLMMHRLIARRHMDVWEGGATGVGNCSQYRAGVELRPGSKCRGH